MAAFIISAGVAAQHLAVTIVQNAQHEAAAAFPELSGRHIRDALGAQMEQQGRSKPTV